MRGTIEIIDPEGARQAKRRRGVLVLAVMTSLALFTFPVYRSFGLRWSTLHAARQLAVFLGGMRTEAISKNQAMEARFIVNGSIDVFQVSSCGPNARRTRIATRNLSEWSPSARFVTEDWVRGELGSNGPVLTRYCYDPLYGSSIMADGLAHGWVFLTDQDHGHEGIVRIFVEGASGDLAIE